MDTNSVLSSSDLLAVIPLGWNLRAKAPIDGVLNFLLIRHRRKGRNLKGGP